MIKSRAVLIGSYDKTRDFKGTLKNKYIRWICNMVLTKTIRNLLYWTYRYKNLWHSYLISQMWRAQIFEANAIPTGYLNGRSSSTGPVWILQRRPICLRPFMLVPPFTVTSHDLRPPALRLAVPHLEPDPLKDDCKLTIYLLRLRFIGLPPFYSTKTCFSAHH